MQPFEFIICTTKNIPDLSPKLVDVISPAVTPRFSTIVLIQNGLNIEKPVHAAFPDNVILSGVSFCRSHQVDVGQIVHDHHDELYVGAFRSPLLDPTFEDERAQTFCEIYSAGGKCTAEFKSDVGWTRWRKLLFNACLNPLCAVLDLDTGRMQFADGALDDLVRPAMLEIRAAAKACGHDLPEDLVDFMMHMIPVTLYSTPSMQVDLRKTLSSVILNISRKFGTLRFPSCSDAGRGLQDTPGQVHEGLRNLTDGIQVTELLRHPSSSFVAGGVNTQTRYAICTEHSNALAREDTTSACRRNSKSHNTVTITTICPRSYGISSRRGNPSLSRRCLASISEHSGWAGLRKAVRPACALRRNITVLDR
nr:uncharacterized protein CFP56_36215 [Quercus suber]